jgi:hypothetical protein
MSFVIKYSFALFPLFFIFPGSLLFPLAGAIRLSYAPGGGAAPVYDKLSAAKPLL